jgi:tRNA(Ile)-lysidine synthase
MASRFASKVKAALRGLSHPPGAPLLVAVSGGADSLALLAALAEGGDASWLTAAHVDHGLRAGSGAEALLVEAAAKKLGAAFLGAAFDAGALARERGRGVEEAARVGRYARLAALAKSAGAEGIATGHTADDQAETVLLRLLRGGRLRDLGGIAPRRLLPEGLWLLRPLLGLRREEARRYVLSRGLSPLDDPSNASLAFTRNRLRHGIMPRLVEESPALVGDLAALAEEARGTAALLEGEVARRAERLGSYTERGATLSVVGLLGESGLMRAEVVRYGLARVGAVVTRGYIEGVVRLLQSEGGRRIPLGPGAYAVREGGVIRLWREG